jgi:Fe-S-cluster-containing dehydrogenase component/DMSO reductase anchor subunit
MQTKNIFIFDQNKCVACHACVLACMNENGFQFPERWRNVHRSNSDHHPRLPLFYLSMACNHCDDAPCLVNCPAKAYKRDKHTGSVIHYPNKCIGCKYCTWACPFDAPKYVPTKGIIEKCTFCNHRTEKDQEPACTELCPVSALEFENREFSREESLFTSPVKVDVGAHLKIIKLRRKTAPQTDPSLFPDHKPSKPRGNESTKITARKEWPLLIFTLLSAFLVSVYASGMTALFSLSHQLIYLALAFISAGFSILHLGKKRRFWRSILHIRNSWLSKEIVFMALFYSAVIIDFFILDLNDYIGIVLGLLFLYSIDMLYRIAHWKWPSQIHSAQTIFILFTFTLFFKELLLFLMVILAIRLMFYLIRQGHKKSKNYLLLAIRVISLLMPALIFVIDIHLLIIFLLLISGEIIDRVEFYNELNVPDPSVEFVL